MEEGVDQPAAQTAVHEDNGVALRRVCELEQALQGKLRETENLLLEMQTLRAAKEEAEHKIEELGNNSEHRLQEQAHLIMAAVEKWKAIGFDAADCQGAQIFARPDLNIAIQDVLRRATPRSHHGRCERVRSIVVDEIQSICHVTVSGARGGEGKGYHM